MDKFEAQQSFWASFGVPAIRDSVVIPEDVQSQWWREFGAYITYEASTGPFDTDTVLSASIWTRSEYWDRADQLAESIESRLKSGGEVVHYDGGILWFTAESPFATPMNDPEDDKIKRQRLSIALHFA